MTIIIRRRRRRRSRQARTIRTFYVYNATSSKIRLMFMHGVLLGCGYYGTDGVYM